MASQLTDRPPHITQRNEDTDSHGDLGIGGQGTSRLGSQETADSEGNGPSQRQPIPASRVTGELDRIRSPSLPPPSPLPPSPSPSAGRKQPASSPPPPPEPLKRRFELGNIGEDSDEEDPHSSNGPQKRQCLGQAKESEEAPEDRPPPTTDGKAGRGRARQVKPKKPPTKPKGGQGKRRSARGTKAAVKECRFPFLCAHTFSPTHHYCTVGCIATAEGTSRQPPVVGSF